MEDMGNYRQTILGEFVDKALEEEFFNYNLKFYSRYVGPTALIFGVIYMLFIVADYHAIENKYSFMVILIIRVLFLMSSVAVYLTVKKVKGHSNMTRLMTGYEIWAIVSFIVIIYQYKSISIMAFFGVMAITSAFYIIPNRLINAQIISVIFNLLFYLLFSSRVDDFGENKLWETAAYSLIFILSGNIEANIVNYYKRKHFADSRELLRLSVTDSLTGIYNRNRFDQELVRWVDYCNIYKSPLSLVIFDIDDFKNFNDKYGHLMGDSILQNIASTIIGTIRKTDIFARWGGEEFVILLPNTDIFEAKEMAERMRICIQKNACEGVENVTCSFGLVSLKKNEDAEALLERADKLLYEAKNRGKNTVVCDACEIPA